MNATDILKYGQVTLQQAIDGLPTTAWEVAGACGVWSIKDIVAHLASYELVLIDILASLAGQHNVYCQAKSEIDKRSLYDYNEGEATPGVHAERGTLLSTAIDYLF